MITIEMGHLTVMTTMTIMMEFLMITIQASMAEAENLNRTLTPLHTLLLMAATTLDMIAMIMVQDIIRIAIGNR